MTRRSKRFNQKYLIIGLVILGLIAVITLWIANRPSRKPTATIPSIASSDSTGSSANKQAASPPAPTPPPQSEKTTPNGGSGSNLPLTAPWGNFVSNHHPGQSGSPTAETSVCNTTPGATCYIKFTLGELTRTLDAQVSDSKGSVIWNWDVKNAGFTSGSWKVTAIATSNGDTKSTSDPISLVVQ